MTDRYECPNCGAGEWYLVEDDSGAYCVKCRATVTKPEPFRNDALIERAYDDHLQEQNERAADAAKGVL